MAKQWTGAMALAASAVAAVAMAHTGASGVVLERMNGMTAMQDTVPAPGPLPADTPMVGIDHSKMDVSNEN